ncbi:MAG: hypothetical protein FH758_02015 [Firmicutes bacterium]|nr:hypothetical protein [Bacillota bacterium]
MSDINIKLDNVEVKLVDKSSGIFSGENNHSKWSSTSKTNQGLGVISRKSNKFDDSKTLVNDPNTLDMPISKKLGR